MAPYTITVEFVLQTLFTGGAIVGFVVSGLFLNRVYDEGFGIFPPRYAPVSDAHRRRAGIAHMLLSATVAGILTVILGVVGVPLSNTFVAVIPSPAFACLFGSLTVLTLIYGLLTVLELGTEEQNKILVQFIMSVGALYSVAVFLLTAL